MPWTRQQVKFLLSSGSPLTGAEQEKMKGELHANPAMGHMKKGYHKGQDTESSTYDWRKRRRPKR